MNNVVLVQLSMYFIKGEGSLVFEQKKNNK